MGSSQSNALFATRKSVLRPVLRGGAVVVTVAALVMSAACDGGGGNAASSTNATLSIAVHVPPNSFDPAQMSTGEASYIWSAVYDTLLYQDANGKLQPNAATAWKYSPDGKTLTLTLRQGMKFSNGHRVEASAVKATMDRMKSTPGSQYSGMLNVDSIRAPDKTTVVVQFKQPDAAFLPGLAKAIGAIADPATLNQAGETLNPVASGPYSLDKAGTVNGSTYVLKRREDYWNKKAYPFKTYTVRVIPDNTATSNALRSGQINASPVDTRTSAQLTAAGFDITRIDATVVAELVLADRAGKKLKPLADVRVRKAINMAFDRSKYVQKLLNNVGKPTVQAFNPNGDAYDPALENAYQYDVAGAKKLLSEAGYPNGFAVTIPSLGYSKPFEPSVTQSLGDIGIKVTWATVPSQDVFAQIAAQKYPMYLYLGGLGNPAGEVQTHFSPIGFANPFRSTDPTLNRLLDQVNAEQNPSEAALLYKQINKFAVDNAWLAPIVYVGNDWATKGVRYKPFKIPGTSIRNFDLPE
jgi:peptide/nickel transport system substrate-binding protein